MGRFLRYFISDSFFGGGHSVAAQAQSLVHARRELYQRAASRPLIWA